MANNMSGGESWNQRYLERVALPEGFIAFNAGQVRLPPEDFKIEDFNMGSDLSSFEETIKAHVTGILKDRDISLVPESIRAEVQRRREGIQTEQ